MIKVLILCTGNSCRSQMAHGFLKSFDNNLDVHSAGTNPNSSVNQTAIKVMKEAGIDISNHQPKSVDRYLETEWDFVITVCDNAKETCPIFTGRVRHRLHMEFEDPAAISGTEEKVLKEFRRIRDEIHSSFINFYNNNLK